MSTHQPVHPWHCLEPQEVLSRLASRSEGLSQAEARQRLASEGPNQLIEGQRRSALQMFFAQFADFMILVLLGAALIAGVIGEPQDTIAILVIVALNAVIGTIQEYRAERAMAALKRMAAPEARVVREGLAITVPARELVSGDIVVLEAGNVVPADLRLLEAIELSVDESALTGESHAASKAVAALTEAELPLGDRCNLAFKGSQVTRGRGLGVVVATAMATELGRIAGLLDKEQGVRTPLQERLTRFGRYLALVVLAICAVVFVSGWLQGQPLLLMFLTAVSLAVAAIPEALPAVVTVSLAFGARMLSRQRALVRRLPAVETLGSVTYICTDKTGTLTENRMNCELFVVNGARHTTFASGGVWDELGRALALNNDVVNEQGALRGDPTELALYEAAQRAGYDKASLEQTMPRLAELPFDSERKAMTTLHRREQRVVGYVKGAPEVVVPLCRQSDERQLLAEAEALAQQGYRILALACREFDVLPESITLETVERELVFLGLVALIDPPRQEVPQAIADCLSAGITPVMITGDHPGTARAIALRLGIIDDDDSVLTGQELMQLSDEQFARRVEDIRVYARVSPEQKIRIVKALQARGEFVAMTGDGVNDAPALKRAGIGVAMGLKGTDVAREAADMVLLDDNFATIVKAVRGGRRVFDNIRKFIKYTMTSNSGEIWTLFLAPFLGLPIPLLPIHILWINLVTDGLPGLAFTGEPAERGIMRRPPRPPEESIFAHGMWQHMVWVGLLIGGLSLASQAWAIGRGVEYWQTVVFTVLTVAQLFHSLAIRSERESLFTLGLMSNRFMLGAVLLTVALQMMVIYLPLFNGIFKTQPLPLFDLAVCFGLASLTLVAVELEKWLVRRGVLYSSRPAIQAD